MTPMDEIWAWRHPRPEGVDGFCIGRTDVAVDARRVRRLARRIERTARRNHLPKVIWTSPLQRCADVGRWLRRRGWVHHIDSDLREMDFGTWDGKRWEDIAHAEVDAWNADFAMYAPGGGESVKALLARASAWQHDGPVLVVAHAGWMRARRWVEANSAATPTAAAFPSAPSYGELRRLRALPERQRSEPAR